MSQSPESCFSKLDNESSPPFSPALSHSGDDGVVLGGSASLGMLRKPQISTRVSLLVEALIRSMIAVYKTDRQKASRSYRRICKRLFHMGLIDKSWSMTELEGARAQFEVALLQLLGVRPDGRSASLPSSLPSLWPGGDSMSQYKREFEEIKRIGGGAFGKVFRVKHKLDGTEYAIKKIPIHSEGLNSIKNYLLEVKTFAGMNHPNIVQYKAAWLEIGPPNDVTSVDAPRPKITIPTKLTEPYIFHRSISFSNSFTNLEIDKSNTNFEISFEGSRNSMTEIDNKGNNSDNSRKDNDDSKDDNDKSLDAVKAVVLQKEMSSPSTQVCWATLYIQMSLCHGTLHEWLRKRTMSFKADSALTSNTAQAFKNIAIKEILIQILKGLSYIHSRGVVHHDIKPSNIFVSADGGSILVQLGDFGLACPLQRARHCFARGTPLYAAPEQLAGRCNPKSDMYSVGIVLFELLEDFSTDMERTRRISELRSCSAPPIPKNLDLNNLVIALVRRSPEERPDAETLLRSLERSNDSTTPQIEALKELLSEKDREIQRLTELLHKHGIREV